MIEVLDLDELTAIKNVMNDSVARRTATFEASDRRFVYAVVRRIVGTAADADDVTQEALFLAYRHRDSFRGDSRYRTWLYRIASTTALGHLRRQRRSRLQLVGSDREAALLDRGADEAKSAEALIEEAEARAAVERALVELPDAYREVLLARIQASEGEVAARLGISVGNVKVRAHRARKQLKDAYERIERSAA